MRWDALVALSNGISVSLTAARHTIATWQECCRDEHHKSVMDHKLKFSIEKQPNDITCGPTCLQAVYRYFGNDIPVSQIIDDVESIAEGGTLAVMLGCDALRRGYTAVLYTFNLMIFDPTWFHAPDVNLAEKLAAQKHVKHAFKLQMASDAYIEFLSLGGEIRMEDLTGALIRKYLKRSIPIIAGLSSTYLYQESREIGEDCRSDDLNGEPSGHFVVFSGYDQVERTVLVADPYLSNPISQSHHYAVSLDRAVCSVLLGIVTYDSNLLVIRPGVPLGKTL
jgi:hypothetical protein